MLGIFQSGFSGGKDGHIDLSQGTMKTRGKEKRKKHLKYKAERIYLNKDHKSGDRAESICVRTFSEGRLGRPDASTQILRR